MAIASFDLVAPTGFTQVTLTGYSGNLTFSPAPVAGDVVWVEDPATVSTTGDLTGADGEYTVYLFRQDSTVTNESHTIGTIADPVAVLSSPTATVVSDTELSGTVDTDTADGDLYVLATANASETASTIIAGGLSQPVTATGAQNVSISGLTAETAYYLHYVQVTGSGNSNVETSAQVTTDAASVAESATTTFTFTAGTGKDYTVLTAGYETYIPDEQFDAAYQGTDTLVGWAIVFDTTTGLTINDQFQLSIADEQTAGDVDIWLVNPATSEWTGAVIIGADELTEAFTDIPQGTLTVNVDAVTDASATISFSYSLSDASSFEQSPNGTNWTEVTSPFDLLGLDADTAYNGEVRAVNSIGAATPVPYSFTTDAEPDTTPPVLTINSLSTTDVTPTVSGTCDDASSLTLAVDGTTYNPTPSAGVWSQQINQLAVGTYVMTLNGEDLSGNPAIEVQGSLIVQELPFIAVIRGIGRRIGRRGSVGVSLRSSIGTSIR